jgi:autotransporter-associated beta strand protein
MKPKYNTTKFRSQTLGTSLVTVLFVCFSGSAQAVTWDGSDSSDWNTATNWAGDIVPNGAAATIQTIAPFYPIITAAFTTNPSAIEIGRAGATGRVDHISGVATNTANQSMAVGGGGANSNGTYNLTGPNAGAGVSGRDQGTGSMTIGGGSVSNDGNLFVGDSATSFGTVNINTSGSLVVRNDIFVGRGNATAEGVMNLESGTVTAGGVGNGCWTAFGRSGGKGTLNMSGGSIKSNGSIFFPRDAGSTGILNLSGGKLEVVNEGQFSMGDGGAGTGTMTQTGGIIETNNREFWVGQSAGTTATYNLSAGTINVGSWVAVGRDGGNGTVNMSGGTWTKTGVGTSFIIGASGPGTLTQSGGLVDVQAGDTWMGENNTGNYTLSGSGEFRASVFQVARGGGATGNVNFNGGTLRANRIVGGGGIENVSFNGTQIIAKAADLNFISGMNSGGATIDGGGLLIDSNGFNLTAPQELDGTGNIVKTGGGTLTLSSGANSYTGNNIINAGGLVLNPAATGTGTITAANGTSFGLNASSPTSQLTSTGVTLGTTTLNFGRGDVVGTNPTVALLNVAGNLAVNGAVNVNVSGARFAVGTIPLIAYTAKTGAGAFNPTPASLPSGVVATVVDDGIGSVYLNITSVALPKWTGILVPRFTTGDVSTFSLDVTVANAGGIVIGQSVTGPGIAVGTTVANVVGNVVTLSLTPTADNLGANLMFASGPGANPGIWDTTTTNWVDQVTGTSSLYANPNPVLFDDDAPGSPAVVLNSTVAPSEVIFNNSLLTYSLSGTGAITGVTGLTKRGTGNLTLSNTNTYDGPTRLEGGTTTVNVIEDLGTPSPMGDASQLTLAGGILNYTGAADTINRGMTLDAAGGGINTPVNLTFTGQILNTGTGGNLRKQGAGDLTLTFNGTNTLASNGQVTDVEAGTLILDGTAGGQVNTLTGEMWVASEPDVPAHLTVLNTTLNISSWLAVGRGNGDTGVTNINVTNSTVQTGNFSTGFNNGLGANASEAFVNLTTSNWTNTGNLYLAESPNSTATVTLNNSNWISNTGAPAEFSRSANTTTNLTISGTSELRTDRLLLALGDGSVANVIVKDSGKLTKTGGSWMAIGNGGTGQGSITVRDSGTFTTAGGEINVADVGTSNGTLNIQDSATVVSGGPLLLAKNSGTSASLNISGGTLTATGSYLSGGNDGQNNTPIATITQTGGSVALNGDDNRTGGTGTATWTVSAGSVTSNGWMTLGRYAGGTGTMSVSGGTVTQNHIDRPFRIAEFGTGVLNVSGTGVVSAPNAGGFQMGGGTTGVGTINLDGGTLVARRIFTGGNDAAQTVSLDGGTLQAAAGANLNFIAAQIGTLSLDANNILDIDSTIDTNGQTVEINKSISDGGGNLIKSGLGTLRLNAANGYLGTTTVTAGTLGGTGSVDGPLQVDAAASVNPGTAVGTFTGNDSVGIDGTYRCEVNGALADKLVVAAQLTIGAGAILDFDATAPTALSYEIATFSTRSGPDFATVDVPAGYEVIQSATNIVLQVAADTPYKAWAISYGISPFGDGAPGADKDNDGQTNGIEFALGGSPVSGSDNAKIYNLVADSSADGDALSELLMTIAVRNGTPVFAGSPSPTATMDGATYTAEGSTTLSSFTTGVTPVAPVTTGLPAAPAGYVYRTFSLNGSNGTTGSGFLRIQVNF